MKRKWTDSKSVEALIQQMRQEGRTRQEIADSLGLEKAQMRLFILCMYIGMRKIKIDDFSDKKLYHAIERYLDRANELLRLNNKLPT